MFFNAIAVVPQDIVETKVRCCKHLAQQIFRKFVSLLRTSLTSVRTKWFTQNWTRLPA